MSGIKYRRYVTHLLKKPSREARAGDEDVVHDWNNKERLAVFTHLIRRLMALVRVGMGLFLRLLRPLKVGWRVSNVTVCLMGAVLGLGAGLIFLRGFIFSPGLAQYFDLQWWYSSRQYPMHYMWGEFIQAPEFINHVLRYPLIYLFPAEVSERLVYLFIFTVMGLSMFFAAYKLTARRHSTAKVPLIAATLATLFFVMNPIVCVRMWNYLVLWFYAFMPLLLYFSYIAFRDIGSFKRIDFFKKAIPVALVLFLMSATPRMPLFFPIFGLAFLAGVSRPYWEYIKRSALFSLVTMVLYVAFSAFWVVPIAMGADTSPYWYIMARGYLDFVSQFVSMWRMFTLQPTEGVSFLTNIYTATGALEVVWKVCVIATPFIALSALLLRRSKLIVWLALFALAFAFLSKGNSPPFGRFYEWLVFDAPVLSSFGYQFRSPPEWALSLMFCYSMLIGFTASYFLGWIKSRVSSVGLKSGIFAATIIILIAVAMIIGYPLLNGNLSGTMEPKTLNSGWVDFNRWMEDEGSDCKITMCPGPPIWGPPKPMFPHYSSGMKPAHSPLLPMFLYRALERGYTMRFGELQTPWNARYVVVWAGPFNREQDDLRLIKQFGSIMVYENLAQCAQVEASKQSVVVLGGVDMMLSLIAIDSYDVVDSSAVFVDQLVENGAYLSTADVVVSSQGNLDLYLSQLDGEYIVAPFDAVDREYTGWVKATAEDIQLGVWHYYLDIVGLENWQYDYGRYLVRSQSPEPLNMPFEVECDGDYDIVVRCLHSAEGEMIKLSLDGESVGDVITKDQVTEFRWDNVGTFTLEAGEHMLTLDSTHRLEAVNLFAVLPHGVLEQYEEHVDNVITNKRLAYVWEGETVFNQSWAEISQEYGGEASRGRVLVLSEGSQTNREVEVARSGNYKMGLRLSGSAVVSIDDEDFSIGSSSLNFAYIGPVYLDKGKHSIGVTPAAGGTCKIDVIWLYSVDDGDEKVEDIFTSDDVPASVLRYEKVDPTKYRVTVNATGPFMMAFAEAYDRLWVARVNGREYKSVPLNSMVNGFWIDEKGELEITIEFKTQQWFYYGVTVTVLSLLAAFGFLLWDYKRRRRGTKLS